MFHLNEIMEKKSLGGGEGEEGGQESVIIPWGGACSFTISCGWNSYFYVFRGLGFRMLIVSSSQYFCLYLC